MMWAVPLPVAAYATPPPSSLGLGMAATDAARRIGQHPPQWRRRDVWKERRKGRGRAPFTLPAEGGSSVGGRSLTFPQKPRGGRGGHWRLLLLLPERRLTRGPSPHLRQRSKSRSNGLNGRQAAGSFLPRRRRRQSAKPTHRGRGSRGQPLRCGTGPWRLFSCRVSREISCVFFAR